MLEGQNGGVDIRAVAAVGETYNREMRARVPGGAQPSRIVDKMLRNSWNLGHIAFMLPKARTSHCRPQLEREQMLMTSQVQPLRVGVI